MAVIPILSLDEVLIPLPAFRRLLQPLPDCWKLTLEPLGAGPIEALGREWNRFHVAPLQTCFSPVFVVVGEIARRVELHAEMLSVRHRDVEPPCSLRQGLVRTPQPACFAEADVQLPRRNGRWIDQLHAFRDQMAVHVTPAFLQIPQAV